MLSKKISKILSNFHNENLGVRTNLSRILNTGKLAGTGNMIILPVDQGFEHGPSLSFAKNPNAYNPDYHINFAIKAGFNAFAAPLGMLQKCSDQYIGLIPTILKINNSNSLMPSGLSKTQSIHGSIEQALQLGCSAIGYTIYPSSGASYDMFEDLARLSEEAKRQGLAVVVWSYPRGEDLNKEHESSLDVTLYATQIAAQLGANIIKVKIPNSTFKCKKTESLLKDKKEKRIELVKQAAFDGKIPVIFSGGATKESNSVIEDAKTVKLGGGNGMIVGRNLFQRPEAEAMNLAKDLIDVFLK